MNCDSKESRTDPSQCTRDQATGNNISGLIPQEMKVAGAQPERNSHLDAATRQAGTEMLIHMCTAG